MVRVDVTPHFSIDASSTSGAAAYSFSTRARAHYGDLVFGVSISESTLGLRPPAVPARAAGGAAPPPSAAQLPSAPKGGSSGAPSLQGLVLSVEHDPSPPTIVDAAGESIWPRGAKPPVSGFKLAFDAGASAPAAVFHTTFPVEDRNVRLAFYHGLATQLTTLEASVDVDEANRASVTYTNSPKSFGAWKPSWDDVAVSWRYKADDNTILEPSYDVGRQAMGFGVTRLLGSDSSVRAHFDSGTSAGTLELAQRTEDGGLLKVSAVSALSSLDAALQVPRISISKEWKLDV